MPCIAGPQGTSVVIEGQARDQGSRMLADAPRHEPGFASRGVLDNIRVRGVNTDTRIPQDGLLRRFGSAISRRPTLRPSPASRESSC